MGQIDNRAKPARKFDEVIFFFFVLLFFIYLYFYKSGLLGVKIVNMEDIVIIFLNGLLSTLNVLLLIVNVTVVLYKSINNLQYLENLFI